MFTITQLAREIGAELIGDGAAEIKAVASAESAGATDITFLSDDKYLPKLADSKAAAVLVNKKLENFTAAQLIVEDVDTALIQTLKLLAPPLKVPEPGIHESVVIGDNVSISQTASIGPHAVIADGVKIGENTIIGPGSFVGAESVIGDNTRLDANVTVHHHCRIGNSVIIQSNSTIGSTGFGYMPVDNMPTLIPHNGGVIIEDFVEIGANTCIDRAKFSNTIIGMGTKIDNLVQIAHNVVIGKCCMIVSQVGIAGSTKVGDGVIFAGQVGVVDNIDIGSGVLIGAQAGVMSNIPDGKKVVGSPAIDYGEKIRQIALTQKLPKMAKQLKALKKKVEALEAATDNKK